MSSVLQTLPIYLPYPALALLLSLLLTRCCVFFLPRFGFVDIPRGRHQHEKPVPRGGGIAIAASFFISVTLLMYMFSRVDANLYQQVCRFLGNFWLPAGIILVTGVLDDRCELRSFIKLLAQIAAGVVIFMAGGGISRIFIYSLPMPVSMVITVLWCVLIINAFNLIDGLDGVAAGLGVISSLLMAVWSFLIGSNDAMAVILLIFGAACLGFLRFNFSPAKIFMGDTGSMFIGLFFACVSMQYSVKTVTLPALLVPLTAIGIPIFDVFLAVWRRFFRKYINKDSQCSIIQGDHDHLHHRILKENGNPRKTAVVIYCLTLLICGLAMLCAFVDSSLPSLIFILLLLTFFVMIRYSSIEVYDTLTCVAKGLRIPHRNFILTAIHPVVDAGLVTVAYLGCEWFCAVAGTGTYISEWSWLIHVAPFVVMLCISGIYRTFWLRVGIIQYYRLIRLLCLAGIIGYVLNCLVRMYLLKQGRFELLEFSVFYMLFMTVAIALVITERFLIHYYESFGYRKLFIRNQGRNSTMQRALIYGGGLLCRIYISKQYCGFADNREDVRIVGIVDDNPALRKLNVYGFDVLGTVDELAEIYHRKPFDVIIVTCRDIEDAKLSVLRDFCSQKSVRLVNFVCRTEDISV